jgi:hypothetical protein
MDARVQSAVADLQRSVDALTRSRERYLGRLVEPRFARVPSLLVQLAAAVERSGEIGAISSSSPLRLPLDPAPLDTLRDITAGARARCVLAGLRPRQLDVTCPCRCGAPATQCGLFGTYGLRCCPSCAHARPDRLAPVAGNLRQLAAYARGPIGYDAVAGLVDVVGGWQERAEACVPEERSGRDLPDLTCQRCKRNRVTEPQPDGRRLLLPALHYVQTPMPGVQCRGCGHVYRGDAALRALAAWQGSERAGAA